jgi:hypothetical protein
MVEDDEVYKITLDFLEGPNAGNTFVRKSNKCDKFSIGNSEECDVVIPSMAIA